MRSAGAFTLVMAIALVYVSYEDAGSGNGLLILVDPGLVVIGAQHAVVSAAQLPPGSGAFGLSAGVPGEEIVSAGLTTDPGGYADSWVRAWGAGDYDAAEVYGSDDAMYHFGIDPVGGTDWARASINGSEVRYQDGGGNILVLVLDLERVAAGAQDGVMFAYYE